MTAYPEPNGCRSAAAKYRALRRATVRAVTAAARAAAAAEAADAPGARREAWCTTRLPNMSCRPTRQISHPSDDPARQLVPALRVRLPRSTGRTGRIPSLVAAGLPDTVLPRDGNARRRRLEALADAVVAELALPGAIPIGPVAALPDLEERADPLLGIAIAARRSGPVWLARRIPSVDGLDRSVAITLLVPEPVRRRILDAVDAPGWHDRVLARALQLEATR